MKKKKKKKKEKKRHSKKLGRPIVQNLSQGTRRAPIRATRGRHIEFPHNERHAECLMAARQCLMS
jgi:hypothetical protein